MEREFSCYELFQGTRASSSTTRIEIVNCTSHQSVIKDSTRASSSTTRIETVSNASLLRDSISVLEHRPAQQGLRHTWRSAKAPPFFSTRASSSTTRIETAQFSYFPNLSHCTRASSSTTRIKTELQISLGYPQYGYETLVHYNKG